PGWWNTVSSWASLPGWAERRSLGRRCARRRLALQRLAFDLRPQRGNVVDGAALDERSDDASGGLGEVEAQAVKGLDEGAGPALAAHAFGPAALRFGILSQR